MHIERGGVDQQVPVRAVIAIGAHRLLRARDNSLQVSAILTDASSEDGVAGDPTATPSRSMLRSRAEEHIVTSTRLTANSALQSMAVSISPARQRLRCAPDGSPQRSLGPVARSRGCPSPHPNSHCASSWRCYHHGVRQRRTQATPLTPLNSQHPMSMHSSFDGHSSQLWAHEYRNPTQMLPHLPLPAADRRQ